MDLIRINKYLADRGVCSRREADKLIADGKVLVNDVPATVGQRVTGAENIVVDGKFLDAVKPTRVYVLYNKPVGVICSTDPKATDNIVEAVGYPERIFNIGRLDVASSGLIMLTNDGDIVNKILRAEGKHEKEYVVSVDRKITPDFLDNMRKGVLIDDEKTLPARIEQLSEFTFRIILVEGRNRQIRKMCETLGFTVQSLKRVRIMHLEIGGLKTGEWRHLTAGEEAELMAAIS
ncbi:MAG: pseudouridine synthase [Patescibacteria group bacterium]